MYFMTICMILSFYLVNIDDCASDDVCGAAVAIVKGHLLRCVHGASYFSHGLYFHYVRYLSVMHGTGV